MLKSIRLVSLLVFALALSGCSNSTTPKIEQQPELTNQLMQDAMDFEGKIIADTADRWYLIYEGKRWELNSIEASNDYLKRIEDGTNHVIKNIPTERLEQFPIVGELLPRVVFSTQK